MKTPVFLSFVCLISMTAKSQHYYNDQVATREITQKRATYLQEKVKTVQMIKIKNRVDTTYVTFVPDDKGNVGEERSVHRGNPEPTVYYYYDDNNRLTDVVRYNPVAKRLLPDYIFEYDAQNRLATMLVTTGGGTDYQKWNYTY